MVQNKKYQQQYKAFKKKQDTFLDLIKRLSNVISLLNIAGSEELLNSLENVVLYDSFKVLVLGELKRGKSTFINALLGHNLLPVSVVPCTAIINEVKWGESKRALLHSAKNGDENAFNLEPQEIDVDEIADYIISNHNINKIDDNLYDKVELFWPLEFCRNGVQIIDSPGLNGDNVRKLNIINYLSTVDAVLFVLSCETPLSKSEIELIDYILLESGHEEMFFIWTRFNLIPDQDKKSIKDYAISKLKKKTKSWEKRIFFIDALDALKGRIKKDNICVANSGIVELESELENFLADDKGRIKILRPARELQRVIQAARNNILERESMLKTDLKTLEERYEAAQKPLKLLQTKREIIVNDVYKFINELQQKIAEEGCIFYNDISNKVDDWNKSFNPKTLINFISHKGRKPYTQQLIKEMSDFFLWQIHSDFLVWQNKILKPLISNSLEEFLKYLDNSTEEFFRQVDTLRLKIAGKHISLVDEVQTKKVSTIERILTAAGGLFIGVGNLGLTGMGAVFGYQEMTKAIILQLLISLPTVIFVTNTLTKFLVMAISEAIQDFFTMKSTNKKFQEEIAKRYASKIRDTAEYQGKHIAEAVIKKLRENLNLIDKGLGQEIENIREQVNFILQEKQKGQKNVDEKIDELQSLLKSLNDIYYELDTLIMK